MLNLPVGSKIFVCTSATDMRKEFAGLSAIVREQFACDPTDGNLFIFINRRRDRMKLLHFADGGFRLYYRLLEAGTFETLKATGDAAKLLIDATELSMLLSGVPVADHVHFIGFENGAFVTETFADFNMESLIRQPSNGLTGIGNNLLQQVDPLRLLSPGAELDRQVGLESDQLVPIIEEAKRRWSSQGVDVSMLDSVDVSIQALDPGIPALSSSTDVWIDSTASGAGWFVDSTPDDNSEFHENESWLVLPSKIQSLAARNVDLLSVVMHEFGHILGFEHRELIADGVMSEFMVPGTRFIAEPIASESASPLDMDMHLPSNLLEAQSLASSHTRISHTETLGPSRDLAFERLGLTLSGSQDYDLDRVTEHQWSIDEIESTKEFDFAEEFDIDFSAI